MLPFVLYLIAGLITAFHIYSLLLLSLYGGGINALHCIAIAGSLGLVVAAYISLFRPRAAARMALIACLAMWSFYGPGIANLPRTRMQKTSAPNSLSPAKSSTKVSLCETRKKSGAVGKCT